MFGNIIMHQNQHLTIKIHMWKSDTQVGASIGKNGEKRGKNVT